MRDNTRILSNRAIARAMNSGMHQILLPWPADRLGVYGANSFDGSPVSPEAVDRAMDVYVQERAQITDADPVLITGICAGRTKNLMPVIVVTIQPKGTQRPLGFSKSNLW